MSLREIYRNKQFLVNICTFVVDWRHATIYSYAQMVEFPNPLSAGQQEDNIILIVSKILAYACQSRCNWFMTSNNTMVGNILSWYSTYPMSTYFVFHSHAQTLKTSCHICLALSMLSIENVLDQTVLTTTPHIMLDLKQVKTL